MKIMKDMLLLGTGLAVGAVAGVKFAVISLGYRFDHLMKGDEILIDKTNNFRIRVLRSEKNNGVRLAVYEDLTSNFE